MTDAQPASLAIREPGRKTVRSESRQRTEMVGVRFTADEKAALTTAAKARGMSLPDYLRLCFEAAQLQEAQRGY